MASAAVMCVGNVCGCVACRASHASCSAKDDAERCSSNTACGSSASAASAPAPLLPRRTAQPCARSVATMSVAVRSGAAASATSTTARRGLSGRESEAHATIRDGADRTRGGSSALTHTAMNMWVGGRPRDDGGGPDAGPRGNTVVHAGTRGYTRVHAGTRGVHRAVSDAAEVRPTRRVFPRVPACTTVYQRVPPCTTVLHLHSTGIVRWNARGDR